MLQASGFSILREVAAIGYHHELYEAVGAGTAYGKMLSALWRESPVPDLADGERLATMASLLHVDATGRPLVAELVESSPLPPAEWLRRYLDAYLVPLLHSFYAHDLVFMPHGENLILVLRDHVVTRVIMKDIGEEIAVLDPAAALPPGVERIRADVPDELRLLSIVTDVFDCVFRFLSALLDEAGLVSCRDFWRVVADCVGDYQTQHPELAERFSRVRPVRRRLRPVLPQPAAAARQPADGRPGRPRERTRPGRTTAEPARRAPGPDRGAD